MTLQKFYITLIKKKKKSHPYKIYKRILIHTLKYEQFFLYQFFYIYIYRYRYISSLTLFFL